MGKNSFKMDSGEVPMVQISGLDEIFACSVEAERVIAKYERFAEHATLSCAMPEIPRYALEDDSIKGTPLEDAYVSVMKLLVRYRKITAWMRSNNIDVEAIAGDLAEVKGMKN